MMHAPLTRQRTSDPKGLRVAQVRRGDLDGRVVQAYLIETDDDMDAYQRLREEHARKALELTLRSPLPIHKFDHGIPSDTPLTGMMSLAWARSLTAPEGQMFGGNPFFQIEPAMLDGLTAMRRALLRGDVVLANRNGGWHTLTPSMEVLSSEEGSLERRHEPIRIPTGAHWMAIENDTKLSAAALAYISSKDKKYALATSIRDRTPGEVADAVRHFVAMGGGVVFAETTGGDVEQLERMAAFFAGLAKEGLRRVVVRTSHLTTVMLGLQKKLEAAGLLVTIMDQYPEA